MTDRPPKHSMLHALATLPRLHTLDLRVTGAAKDRNFWCSNRDKGHIMVVKNILANALGTFELNQGLQYPEEVRVGWITYILCNGAYRKAGHGKTCSSSFIEC